MNPISFERDKKKKHLGFSAQEIQKILPEIVAGSKDKLLLRPEEIIPVLVNAIKEQDERITRLEKLVFPILVFFIYKYSHASFNRGGVPPTDPP